MTDRLHDFVVDAREHLAVVETSLLALERRPPAAERAALVDHCFRAIHSIKGDAGFLGLEPIRELAHAMETLLESVREEASQRAIEALLAARDRLATLADSVRHTEQIEITDILEQLSTSARGATTPVPRVADVPPERELELELDLSEWNRSHPGAIGHFVRQVATGGMLGHPHLEFGEYDLRVSLPSGPLWWRSAVPATSSWREVLARLAAGLSPTPGGRECWEIDLTDWSQRSRGLVSLFVALRESRDVNVGTLAIPVTDLSSHLPAGPVLWHVDCEPDFWPKDIAQRLASVSRRLQRGAATTHEAPPRHLPEALAGPIAEASSETGSPIVPTSAEPIRSVEPAAAVVGEKSSTLRVQVELLDRLMTLVGELTLVRNQSLMAFAGEDGPQRAIIQRLNSVTSELQDATLRARMQPVGNLFNKFPRMVRDLARQLGKQVEIDLDGREVELDKTILEQLSDPLTHLVRNSVDHGIESPEQRVAQGKPPAGHITLSATHEDGQVRIEIRDDGRGIDPAAVRAKALAMQLRTEGELDRLTPGELFSLILLPGFSTATMVTEVSGRGVGMDVVKTNIQQMEGTLNIDSTPGRGCSMVVHLPLTLAIIPCLIVTVDGERFAAPQREVDEVVCLHPQAPGRVEQAFDTEVYRLRDRLVPIVRLRDVLARPRPFTAATKTEILKVPEKETQASRIEYILIMRVAGRRFGLLVDEVLGTQEIVVKPMHPSMKQVAIFTGATILGDGRIALIIDAEGIVQHARLSFAASVELAEEGNSFRDRVQMQRVLLFEYGSQEQFALPLLQVRRIELIGTSQIERVGELEYVTVDGVSTRIVRLDKVVHTSSPDQTESASPASMSLILPRFISQPVGILVTRIVDTESLAVDLQSHPEHDPGILGTAVVRGRLTLFLDIHVLTEKVFGRQLELLAGESDAAGSRPKRLLLIDDTAFFREVVRRYLTSIGHEVTTAVDGADGLARLGSGSGFDLIVSDIEMPVMDGWEFAREARRRGIRTPMLALTSLSGEQYEAKAKDCGFDGYEVKLDHDRLLRKVDRLLAAQQGV